MNIVPLNLLVKLLCAVDVQRDFTLFAHHSGVFLAKPAASLLSGWNHVMATSISVPEVQGSRCTWYFLFRGNFAEKALYNESHKLQLIMLRLVLEVHVEPPCCHSQRHKQVGKQWPIPFLTTKSGPVLTNKPIKQINATHVLVILLDEFGLLCLGSLALCSTVAGGAHHRMNSVQVGCQAHALVIVPFDSKHFSVAAQVEHSAREFRYSGPGSSSNITSTAFNGPSKIRGITMCFLRDTSSRSASFYSTNEKGKTDSDSKHENFFPRCKGNIFMPR